MTRSRGRACSIARHRTRRSPRDRACRPGRARSWHPPPPTHARAAAPARGRRRCRAARSRRCRRRDRRRAGRRSCARRRRRSGASCGARHRRHGCRGTRRTAGCHGARRPTRGTACSSGDCARTRGRAGRSAPTASVGRRQGRRRRCHGALGHGCRVTASIRGRAPLAKRRGGREERARRGMTAAGASPDHRASEPLHRRQIAHRWTTHARRRLWRRRRGPPGSGENPSARRETIGAVVSRVASGF